MSKDKKFLVLKFKDKNVQRKTVIVYQLTLELQKQIK